MPHSDAENRRRREMYLEGRLQGLNPREAGHLYNLNARTAGKIAAAQARPFAGKIEIEAAPIARDRERHAQEVARGERPDRYEAHNLYGGYARVRADFIDAETGRREHVFFTVVFDRAEVPTTGQIIERARDIIQRNRDSHYTSVEREGVGISVLKFSYVPDRTTSST